MRVVAEAQPRPAIVLDFSDEVGGIGRTVEQRALRLLRSLVPGTFEQHDPAPHRDILFGIYIEQMSGRSSQR